MAALLAAPLQPAVLPQVLPQHKSTHVDVKPEVPPPEIIVHRQLDSTTGQERIVQRFSVGRQLGRGAFGSCFEVRDLETKQLYAAKVIAKASLKRKSQQAKVRSPPGVFVQCQSPTLMTVANGDQTAQNCTTRSHRAIYQRLRGRRQCVYNSGIVRQHGASTVTPGSRILTLYRAWFSSCSSESACRRTKRGISSLRCANGTGAICLTPRV